MHDSELRTLVGKHKVVFDIRPALSVYTGERVTVGYDIELRGTHERGVTNISPGCPRCEAVWEDLRRIADAVVPHDVRQTVTEMPEFDHSLHQDSHEGRQDVQLTIEIRHREDYNRPLDDSETRFVQDISAALRRLGAQEHSWSEWSFAANLAPEDR